MGTNKLTCIKYTCASCKVAFDILEFFATQYSVIFLQLTWMGDTIELVYHVTLWNLNSFFSNLCWCGPLHSDFPGDVAYACTNI